MSINDVRTRYLIGLLLLLFFRRTWAEFTTLVGHGKLFGLVALQRRALGFRIDLVALDEPVQTNATQTRFQIHRFAVLEQYVAFGPARFCEQRPVFITVTIFIATTTDIRAFKAVSEGGP